MARPRVTTEVTPPVTQPVSPPASQPVTPPVTTVKPELTRAQLVERAIRGTGENREIEGTGTAPVLHMELSLERRDGSKVRRRVGFVHCVVEGTPGKNSKQVFYRVGMVDGKPCMVLSGKSNSETYKVVWEGWADGMTRADRRKSFKMKTR